MSAGGHSRREGGADVEKMIHALAELLVALGHVSGHAPDHRALIVDRHGASQDASPQGGGGEGGSGERAPARGGQAEGGSAKEKRAEVARVAFGSGDRGEHCEGAGHGCGPKNEDRGAGGGGFHGGRSACDGGEHEETGHAQRQGQRAIGEIDFRLGKGPALNGRADVQPRKVTRDFHIGMQQVGAETVGNIGRMKLLAVDFGEAVLGVLDVDK